MKFQWNEPHTLHSTGPMSPTNPTNVDHWIIRGASSQLAIAMDQFAARMLLLGHHLAFVQVWRSPATQNALYAQGRTKPGRIVTDARAGQSAHCCMIGITPASQAFDIAPQINGQIYWPMDEHTQDFWSDARDTGRMLGLVWGATFNTPPRDFGHFQLSTFKKVTT